MKRAVSNIKAKEFQKLLGFIVKELLDKGEEFRNCVEIVHAIFKFNNLPVSLRQCAQVVRLSSEGRYH